MKNSINKSKTIKNHPQTAALPKDPLLDEPGSPRDSKSLKIAIVLDDSLDRPDGVQQYVKTLGSWLNAQGHTVHYLVGESVADGNTVYSLTRNVRVGFNKNRLSIPLPANKKAIKNLLIQEKYDILHIQMPYNPALAGRLISLAGPQTAVVATFHILPFGRMQRVANKALAVAQKRSLRRLDAICSVSSAAAAFAKNTYGLDTQVIPNMIDMAKWQMPDMLHPRRLVYLGRLVPRKGCYELLVALIHLKQDMREELEIIIASDGPERRRLQRFAHDNQLHNVHFVGYVDEAAKPGLLASAEIAVFPSLGGESFGIVLIEAMAAGAGVVLGGNNPGYASVLGEWPQVMVDPRQPKAFARKLEELIINQPLRSEIHQKQQQAVRRYDVNHAGKQIVQMYEAALHSRRNLQ